MKNVTIKFDTTSAAFEPRPHDEIARILRELADKFERGAYIIYVYDANGNRVGSVEAEA